MDLLVRADGGLGARNARHLAVINFFAVDRYTIRGAGCQLDLVAIHGVHGYLYFMATNADYDCFANPA